MKAMPTDDDCFGAGQIREDGRKIHPSYLFQAKTPAESKGGWDGLKLVATTPGRPGVPPDERRRLLAREKLKRVWGARPRRVGGAPPLRPPGSGG